MLGWLLPTLLLLGPCKEATSAAPANAPAASPHARPMGHACAADLAAGRWPGSAAALVVKASDSAAAWTEEGLRGLLGARCQRAPSGEEAPPAGVPTALRWALGLQAVWLACCVAAPLPFAH